MATAKTQPTWTELLGSNEWEGLLDPVDLSLRKFILRCGDFCQATYDAFISDANSKFCGSSRYGMKSLFQNVCLPSASDYQVVAFLYATSSIDVSDAFLINSNSSEAWDRQSNWMGYIAVTTDQVSKANGRREVYVAWRGTIRNLEWADVLQANLVPATPLLGSGNGTDGEEVMEGWLMIYTSSNPDSPFSKTSAKTQVLTKIKELMEQYKDENLSLIFTGHSLGAVLAALSAFDVVENGVPDHVQVAAFVFGLPMLGNKVFCDKLKALLRILHVRNVIDFIPHYPSTVLGYAYAGIELLVDSRKSPYLKTSLYPFDWHNLQGLLHVVAGWNGGDGEFELKVKRSLALVNKRCNFLKDEYNVPGLWWVEKNKGMVLDENGDWVSAMPFQDDLPLVPGF
ncbi:phospholipase A1-IIdelta-like [Cornus florida]|uniref:phospholipase A1-IIdelta-like n=1 Tax=Cornus florida TaxID=4283 RepID=UPI0028969B63|nr:phospholipase A1-IIdelta-like [Cornus florida]